MSLAKKWERLPIRTIDRVAEIAWFDDIIGGDTAYLGLLDNERRSTFAHCKDILLEADRLGFNSILLPSAYTVGQDVLPFATGVAPYTKNISLLTAVRTGELHPPMLARQIANLDHILKGRLAINIINSDLPGLREPSELRYKRCAEVIQILKQAWTQDRIDFDGDIYKIHLSADPVKPYQQNGGPLLYFGGISEGSKQVCAEYCDTFLMWPEKEDSIYATMRDMTQRAAALGRKIDFGLRIHLIVRETEAEAKAYAKQLVSRLDAERAAAIRSRGEDSRSLGVLRQDNLRKTADEDGFVEDILWTDIGKVFSGCGAGLVGSAEQVIEKLNRYQDMGIRSFVFSGFPLIEESRYVARYILPHFKRVSLARLQGRIPNTEPVTPLTTQTLV